MRIGPLLFWLGISVWVGGLAALGLAAPTIFRTAPSRESAGEIFAAVLRSFSRVEIVCALLAAGGMALTWKWPLPTIEWARAALLAIMFASLVILHAWLVPSMDELRPQIHTNEKSKRVFTARHRFSEGLYKAELLAGLALIALSAWTSNRPKLGP
ncbi:MAG TPA: DUF4149 domain-containing protein [Candidatus Eisenbacteria bacterium]|nr:DUF4149 domain-containing protein [Candidatus Eisenbacteria bacterium]